MMCYSCRKYDGCELPWKCSSTMYDCSAYELEQTNEEWMKSLDTEDFAEAIFAFMDSVSQELTGEKITNKEDVKREVVIKWLKETYDEM